MHFWTATFRMICDVLCSTDVEALIQMTLKSNSKSGRKWREKTEKRSTPVPQWFLQDKTSPCSKNTPRVCSKLYQSHTFASNQQFCRDCFQFDPLQTDVYRIDQILTRSLRCTEGEKRAGSTQEAMQLIPSLWEQKRVVVSILKQPINGSTACMTAVALKLIAILTTNNQFDSEFDSSHSISRFPFESLWKEIESGFACWRKRNQKRRDDRTIR